MQGTPRVMLTLFALTLLGGADRIDAGSQAIQSKRFSVLDEFNGQAVLDRDTQLIWERSPSPLGTAWSNAPLHCALKSIGGRTGWRLPSFYELMSLIDPSVKGSPSRPMLPTGHPFSDIKAAAYWSGTSFSGDPRHAYAVDFLFGDVSLQGKNGVRRYWCARASPSSEVHRLPDR
jgi:hypothetical protein